MISVCLRSCSFEREWKDIQTLNCYSTVTQVLFKCYSNNDTHLHNKRVARKVCAPVALRASAGIAGMLTIQLKLELKLVN